MSADFSVESKLKQKKMYFLRHIHISFCLAKIRKASVFLFSVLESETAANEICQKYETEIFKLPPKRKKEK